MISKTIGSGGDYTDMGLAWAYLATVDPLSDDYNFTIISNFTEATGITFTGSDPVFNGHTVQFLNPSNYQITISTSIGYSFRPASATLSDVLVLDGLKITTAATGATCLQAFPGNSSQSMTVFFKNITLIGPSNTTGTSFGIRQQRAGNSDHFLNCRVTNFKTGIAVPGTTDANTTGTDHIVENCAIYSCGTGISLDTTSAAKNSTIKNTVAFSCITRDFSTGGANNIISNCADGDNTISSSGAILTSNITGIVSGNFLSVTSSSSNFLLINNFSPLFRVGNSTLSSWNTTDINGDSRPKQGRISIGVNEPEAPMVPTFQKLNLLTAKVQSALGTKATPAAADFITVDDNFSLDYKKEFAEQALAQGIFGNPQSVAGMSMVDVKVTLPIIPTGSATVPNVGNFLNCCGMLYALATSKHSWTPTSIIPSNWLDMTLWGYTGDKTTGDSIITKAHSVMFDYEISGEVGKPCTITFTGKGVPDGVPAAGTYLTDSISAISTVPPAVLKNATQTINGLSMHILKFSVKGGNDVQFIKSMGDDSGNLQSMIVNKKATWAVTAYMEDASSINPTTGMAAGTLATTTIKFGSAAASLISITSGSNKSEILECKQGVDNGLMTWEISGTFVDNNFTIAINDS